MADRPKRDSSKSPDRKQESPAGSSKFSVKEDTSKGAIRKRTDQTPSGSGSGSGSDRKVSAPQACASGGQTRQRVTSGGSSSSGEDDANAGSKKQKVQGIMVPGTSASPPRFVTLEEIMKAATGVSNMALAHEIAVNKDFLLKQKDITENSLEKQVKEIVHKAFWEALKTDLAENPPNYKHAFVLLEEIKQGLLTVLPVNAKKTRDEIIEMIDLDLIRQQAEKGTLDVNYYGQYIISTMSKLCAPIRDERIHQLTQTKDLILLFRGILEVIDLMKLDIANFTIQQFRPHIQQHSVQYEKEKFADFLKTQEDGLQLTREWLQRSLEKLKSDPDTAQSINANKIIVNAYLELLQWNAENPFPETLVMDESRFSDLRNRYNHMSLLAAVLLITYNIMGPSISEISDFKATLKQHISLLISLPQTAETDMENIAAQVIAEIKEVMKKRGMKPLDSQTEANLKIQLLDAKILDNRIHSLIRTRIIQFLEVVLGSSSVGPIQVPPGLTTLQAELTQLAGHLLGLVNYNRSVFGEYYADIVKQIWKK